MIQLLNGFLFCSGSLARRIADRTMQSVKEDEDEEGGGKGIDLFVIFFSFLSSVHHGEMMMIMKKGNKKLKTGLSGFCLKISLFSSFSYSHFHPCSSSATERACLFGRQDLAGNQHHFIRPISLLKERKKRKEEWQR